MGVTVCLSHTENQVTEYVGFTNRLPLTLNYELTPQEQELYRLLEAYLTVPCKVAYPQMETYDLTLMFFHILSSSSQAFCKTLDGAISRLQDGEEKSQLNEMRDLAESIGISGKMSELLRTLKKCFAAVKQMKFPQKALVFVDNLTTLGVLSEMMVANGYPAIRGTEQEYIERFCTDKSAVLIATDAVAKGLAMAYFPQVVNYDLLYNAIEIEQRISRCHRQGQQSDVLVSLIFSLSLTSAYVLHTHIHISFYPYPYTL